MFRSQIDHHQGGTIYREILCLPDDGQSVTETCRRSLEFKQYKCFIVLFIKNDNLVQLV